MAWLGLSIPDRHQHIMETGSLVTDAAAHAISSIQLELAIEWLEQGRSIIWSQLLNLRSPVDELKQAYPQLADDLEAVSIEDAESVHSISRRSHDNAEKRVRLLQTIRELPGFKRFLLPKTISELSPAATKGIVVCINVSRIRCDALALSPDARGRVIHVPLPNFTLENGRLWQSLLDILPVLDALAIMTPTRNDLPHVWWCLTGPLTFLPVHAAGLYGENDSFGSKLSDFAISSHTPSLTALIQYLRPQSEQKKIKMLAVAQPSPDGQAYIPGTQHELDQIESHARNKLPVHRLEGNGATVDSVKERMRDSDWVRFACHGIQQISEPTNSALLLAGSMHYELMHYEPSYCNLNLPNATFAFLSACQTAMGDKKLRKEAVHLAGGMLLAGYRSVIGTMWTIVDNDAPQVAGDVYEHLFKSSPPDHTEAAEALHFAVQKLREQDEGRSSFFRWVPFIHLGV
ncbi:CHAT domain-containing protein [Mycena capillaripes]|nr:CHAT domain-containing protein [Mycena capillaripes]